MTTIAIRQLIAIGCFLVGTYFGFMQVRDVMMNGSLLLAILFYFLSIQYGRGDKKRLRSCRS